jgi:hypothetical protein
MAHAASPRFTRQEDRFVWLMVGGKHPCSTSRKSLQFHDAVYWTFAVVSKGEAGMVKQDLSEAAPRQAQLAARPKPPRFGMLRTDDQLQRSSHVWPFATGAFCMRGLRYLKKTCRFPASGELASAQRSWRSRWSPKDPCFYSSSRRLDIVASS